MISLNKPISSSAIKNKEENKLKIGQELVENLPIFTMKNDLESVNGSSPKEIKNNSNFKQAYPVKKQKIPEKQNSSPFLNQTSQIKDEKKEIPQQPQQMKKEVKWEKIIMAGIICFLLLAFGAGGYYYWISKQNDPEKITNENESENPKPFETENISFSIEKPNYLSIDIVSMSEVEIKETLKKYAKRVADSKALTPIEFIVTDSKNDPINFALFTSKSGISFSQDLLSSLNAEEKFSLFIYNDKLNTRLGFAINSMDDYKLKKSISQEEANMTKEIEPLFLDIPHNLESNTFSSSSYNGTEIRFLNLTPSNELTVDYAIFQNKLVVGTTKMTLRSIMDYIKNHSQTKTLIETTDISTSTAEGN